MNLTNLKIGFSTISIVKGEDSEEEFFPTERENSEKINREKRTKVFEPAQLPGVKPKPPKCYIGDILAASDNNVDEHLEYPDQIFMRVGETRLQMNIMLKCLELLRFWMTHEGYRPLENKE